MAEKTSAISVPLTKKFSKQPKKYFQIRVFNQNFMARNPNHS